MRRARVGTAYLDGTLGGRRGEMAIAKGTVMPGTGHSITLKGNPLPLSGTAVKVGEPLPSATVVGGNMQPLNIADTKGKVRIINVVPSLDTPTCDAQTHELVEKDPELAQNVELVTVSMDLPFAQARWARNAKVEEYDVPVGSPQRGLRRTTACSSSRCACSRAPSSSPTRTAWCVTCRSCRK